MTEENETAEWQEEKRETLKISDIEDVLNMHAMPLAAQRGIKPEQFRITLATQTRGIMHLRSGPVVQITLQYPSALSEVNTLLREAFKLIVGREMISSWAIEPMAMILKRTDERKQWYREQFGDECEIFADLLPKIRLRTTRKVTHSTTLTDKETGISVTTDYDPSKRTSWEVEQEARIKLSRIVRQFEATTDES